MTGSDSHPRPTFHSARLRAEPVELRHAQAMAAVLSDPQVYQYLGDDPPTLAKLERQYSLLESGKSPDGSEHWLTWILVPTSGCGAPVGFLQATIEEPRSALIAYVLGSAHWRQGYGREAVTAMLDTVFAHYDVRRAIAEMDTRNAASIALIESLGFHHVETLRDAAQFKGSINHEHVYELSRQVWRERRGVGGISS